MFGANAFFSFLDIPAALRPCFYGRLPRLSGIFGTIACVLGLCGLMSETTATGQFNIGVDQQHILPASAGYARPLYCCYLT